MKNTQVFVGLSGGVDSALTASILQSEGANVTGVFIKGWYPPELPCTWASDRRDAMRVAAQLRIPFVTLDASAEYKKSVIDYLIEEYGAGRTPNPDVMCNRDVKFGAFFNYVQKHPGAYLATGHYARLERDTSGMPHLLRGVDSEKDQSYFLWAVASEALQITLFPLGRMKKSAVRTRARKANLPVASKKDSQGICFLGPVSMDDFLHAEFQPKAGKAVDMKGMEVGTHQGAILHTLGERASITGDAGPWYVIQKNLRENILVVSHERIVSGNTDGISLTSVNMFSAPSVEEVLTAQYRYHGPLLPGVFDTTHNVFAPTTPATEPIAAGQSLVLYRNDECIGGGIIA